MPTSVHIPPELLAAADRRARQMKVSRNRLIIHALERELAHPGGWSPGFFESLAPGEADLGRATREMESVIRSHRTRKPAPPWSE